MMSGAVETCLLLGLRKRSLGLFKNAHTTMALLQKVGKTFEPAAVVLRCVADVEKNSENSRFALVSVSTVFPPYHHHHHHHHRGHAPDWSVAVSTSCFHRPRS